MIEPLTMGLLMGGSALVGGIMDYWASSEEAQALQEAAEKGNQVAREQLQFQKDLIAKLEANWKTPQFASTQFTPEEVKYLGDFMPSVAQYVQEKNPELITGMLAGTERASQLSALSQLAGETRAKPVMVEDTIKDKMELAQAQAQAGEASQRATMLRDLASKGLLGSGQEVMAGMLGAQQAGVGLRQAGLQVGLQAAQEQTQAERAEDARRMAAIQALGSLSTNVRGQQLGIEEQNVNAINAFNQRAAMTKQNWENQRIQNANAARLRNLNTQQDLESQNVGSRNQAQQWNISRGDRIAEAVADAQNAKLRAIVGGQQNISDKTMAQAQTQVEQDAKTARANQAWKRALANVVYKAPAIAGQVSNIDTTPNVGQGGQLMKPPVASHVPVEGEDELLDELTRGY